MAATSKAGKTSWRSFRALQVLLGLLLLTAAGLKTHQLATEPVVGNGLFDSSRWFLLLVVEYECFLAVWLISGLFPRTAWSVTLGTFVLFAVLATAKVLAGEASCGCFGRVETSPWFALGIDIGAIFALCCQRSVFLRHTNRTSLMEGNRRTGGGRIVRWTPRVAVLLWFAVAFTCGWIARWGMKAEAVVAIGQRVGQAIVIEPERMIGKAFDLGKYIDVGDQLAEGRWLVLVYRPGCPDCELLMRTLPRAVVPASRSESLAFVAATSGLSRTHSNVSGVLWGRLDERAEWIVGTPLVIAVAENRVVGVRHTFEMDRNGSWVWCEATFDGAVVFRHKRRGTVFLALSL